MDEEIREQNMTLESEVQGAPEENWQRGDDLENKKGKRKGPSGFLFFIFGCFFSIIVVFGGIRVYCRLTDSLYVFGSRNSAKVQNSKILDQTTINRIDELTQLMDMYYYDEYDLDTIRDKMYSGLIAGIGDKYSIYYTPEEFQKIQEQTSGTYCGIGAGLAQDSKTKEVTITKVYEGTPSEEAGLLKDDQLLKVGQTESTSKELTELVQEIRGEEGTTVHLTVYRQSTNQTFEVDVERKSIELPSVAGKMLEDHVGYIQITEFQSKTAAQFESVIAELQGKGMERLIVDLRDNPGGLVPAVTKILDDILPEGVVVYTEDKYGNRHDFTSSGDSQITVPLVVLVNENSASASEIFAGAIKDYNAGTLVGEKTFGKGIVQSIIPLKDGAGLRITTAKYFTPNGNYIHGEGITPDIELEYQFLGGENDVYDAKFDNQLQKALEVVKSK